MAPRWQPGEFYNYGDVVEYEGVEYKIIQPHRSQGDWTPPVTPALWGRMQSGGGHHQPHHEKSGQWGEDCKPQHQPPHYEQQPFQQQQHHQNQQQDQPPVPTPVVQPTKEEKHWYDVDDKTKHELEIGGGILAGVAALGAGYYAYKEHGKKEEEKQAQQWSSHNWVADAQLRTQQFRSGQYQAPVAWVWNEGKQIPRDAIQGGEERGERLYICRAYHDGGLLIGKASSVFKEGAVIGYKKDEIHLSKYEILVGDSRAVKWVSCSGKLNVNGLNARPVEGGREPDGTVLYIAQAPYNDAVHPGKACVSYDDGCFIPYGKTEKKVKQYAVLCYV
ncbi:carbohydrate-binding module family 12 protein [Phlebopus sp. FC_14]|nr:carbohydrate-binding module family 12 protein [Phlebopus sp. FC_14]